ncbi:ThuA domain-containing protein [Allomuricauda sp. F6463D]|uniref:ThuA domain-containing protein n=1 Tax=Allomuricauda sp. F6463D TaxID=2926409 RepID=UPI001FF33031|nr:ThuA domain-containing protein [Muricauda sp. F6463D]MCK0159205.1 ThuA domain-containing protein [Muricauda sp. F6463D]
MKLMPSLTNNNGESSRFFVLFAIAFSLATVLSAQINNSSDVYSSVDRPRALVMMGDRYHSPVHVRDGLMRPLALENIPVVYIENHEALTAEALKEFDLLIFLKDGNIWPNGYERGAQVQWMTDEQQQAVYDFVDNGGGFLALHNSHGLYPPNGPYYEVFKGDFGGHPAPEEFMVRVEDKNHPITAGVEDFRVFDEQHMSKYYGDPDQLLLRNISDANKSAPAGWWREMGKGRFVYLAPGHTKEAIGHPMMVKLLRNSVRWLTKQTDEK